MTALNLLVASLVALVLGPATVRALGARRGALAVVDGFVLTALVALLGLHVLPESLHRAGSVAAVAAALGALLPGLVERRVTKLRLSPTMILALSGLFVHALLDGAALAGVGHGHDHDHDRDAAILGLAVILHRLPMGLAIWWAVRPHGRHQAVLALGLVGLATVGGYLGGRPLMASLPAEGLAVFQALVAGSLVHVVFAHPPVQIESRRDKALGALGALAGLGAMGAFMGSDPSAGGIAYELDAERTFVALALEMAPAWLLGLLFAGLATAVLAGRPPGRSSEGLAGAAEGLTFGLAPAVSGHAIYSRHAELCRAGVPASAALTFLVAAPAIGLEASLLTVPLLGVKMAAWRLVGAMSLALLVGVVIGRRLKPPTRAPGWPQPAKPQGVVAGFRFGLSELTDHAGPWALAGLGVAALVEPMFDGSQLSELSSGWLVPFSALLGAPLYLSVVGATPLVAVMMHKGLSAGAGLAFLLTGPAIHLAALGVVHRAHGRRAAAGAAALVTALACLVGWCVDLWAPAATGGLDLHALAAMEPESWRLWCVGACVVLLVASLFRQGPRGALTQLVGVAKRAHGLERRAGLTAEEHPEGELSPSPSTSAPPGARNS